MFYIGGWCQCFYCLLTSENYYSEWPITKNTYYQLKGANILCDLWCQGWEWSQMTVGICHRDNCHTEWQLTCISGSSGLRSPICLSRSLVSSHSRWYLVLKRSRSAVTLSAPDTASSGLRLTLPSRLGWSSSSSHWNLSRRRSWIC